MGYQTLNREQLKKHRTQITKSNTVPMSERMSGC
jgi:hypothetical protein